MRTVRALRGSIYNRIGMLNITLLLSTDDNEGGSLGRPVKNVFSVFFSEANSDRILRVFFSFIY